MTRWTPWLLFLLSMLFSLGAAAKSPFESPAIALSEVEGGLKVSVSLTPVEGAAYPRAKVPFSAEPYTLLATPASGIVEYNLFGSGLAMDLDGDGDTSGTIRVGCYKGGILQLNDTPVRPFVEVLSQDPSWQWQGNYRNPDGSPRVAQLGKKGAWFAAYTPCGPEQATTLALGKRKRDMAIHELPGPLLQLMVLEEVFIPTAEAKVKIEGLTLNGARVRNAFEASTHTYEPIFQAQPVWHAVTWRMIPLGADLRAHTIEATLALEPHDGRRVVLAILNQSSAPGIRERVGSTSAVIEP